MARAATVINRNRLIRRPPNRPVEPPSLEQIRERFEFGTQERAVGELVELSRLKEVCREATNAQNRQNTQAGKAMGQMIIDGELQHGDEIRVGEFAYAFDYTHNEEIDARKFYELLTSGKISLEIFLKCIKVQKDMSDKLVGTAVIEPMLNEVTGKKADVRIEKLEKPVDGVKIVKKPPKPKKRLLRDTDHKPIDNVSNPVRVSRGRRRLNVGTR